MFVRSEISNKQNLTSISFKCFFLTTEIPPQQLLFSSPRLTSTSTVGGVAVFEAEIFGLGETLGSVRWGWGGFGKRPKQKFLEEKQTKKNTGVYGIRFSSWWFQRCFIFNPKIGEMIQFDSCFSGLLKPPTSVI